MNTCKKCGSPAPEGKDLCWICEHEGHLPQKMPDIQDLNWPSGLLEE